MTENELKKSADEALVKDVTEDFARRREERRPIERGWQMNMNFVSGNQYCGINSAGEIYEEEKTYFWQTHRVFNHIAPLIDMRCAKLGRIRPALSVRAAGDGERDKHSAAIASAILAAAAESGDLDGVISDATVWSETCGTAFYKVMWDGGAGSVIGATEDGKKINQGDVKTVAVPPFEIYPFSLSEEKLSAQPSIIHARAVPVQDIYTAYGVKTAGRDLREFYLSPYAPPSHTKRGEGADAVRHGYELVIERYSRPTEDCPDGRLTVIAGDKLLFDGALPYINGGNGTREYPFVKQTSLPLAGSFFGASVVDRLIPLQRAYNAVKNRKHEFLNRLALGTMTVEDGSLDADELAEEGLVPGKILVYRQGARPPEMLDAGNVPKEFGNEEENLLIEFTKVSGTGDLVENADSFAGITSATGLQLILDQDEAKLDYTYRQIKRALQSIGRHILRLYRQFASDVRLMKFAGENNALSLFYFKGSDISSDDVTLEADNDSNLTPAQRRAAVYEIMDRGLFADGEGKLSVSAKNKILELLGYKGFSGERDLGELNRARAGEENLAMRTEDAPVRDYDDHATHITEHTAYLLTENPQDTVEKRICAHINMHRQKLKETENDG